MVIHGHAEAEKKDDVSRTLKIINIKGPDLNLNQKVKLKKRKIRAASSHP
jgi:hypothetical protein